MTKIFNRNMEKEKRRALRSSMTNAERQLWEMIRNKQIDGYRFRRQVSIGPYVVDFYCPEKRLAIELDGKHHSEAITRENDKYREEFLESMGISVLRFTNEEVLSDCNYVCSRIKEALYPPRAARLPLRKGEAS